MCFVLKQMFYRTCLCIHILLESMFFIMKDFHLKSILMAYLAATQYALEA